MDDEEKDPLKSAIETGSEITGSVAGAALGLLAAGPPGALGGAAAGPVVTKGLRWIATEIRERFTGPREEVRVGAVLTYSLAAISDRLDAGQSIRDDGFFHEEREPGRTEAEEVAEAVVLAAQREHEERKLPYMGKLHASIAFMSAISRAEANMMIHLLDRMTYQQVLVLQAVGLGRLSRASDFRGHGNFQFDLITALTAAKELHDLGLVTIANGDTMLGVTDFKPGTARLQGFGQRLFVLCGMNVTPDEDGLAEIVRILDQE